MDNEKYKKIVVSIDKETRRISAKVKCTKCLKVIDLLQDIALYDYDHNPYCSKECLLYSPN